MSKDHLRGVNQLIVVTAPEWGSVEATLQRFERPNRERPWESVGLPVQVTLGKTGMAWGRGLIDLSSEPGEHKKEGDNKSPAGLYRLGAVFGALSEKRFSSKMPFLAITDDMECVDDSSSQYYNQIVYRKSLPECDWSSSEKMKEIGPLYDLGLVIHHNTSPSIPHAGSALFMHVWRFSGAGTAGCTAMEKKDLQEIVSWLNQEQNPCLVQLPQTVYQEKQASWGLPTLF